MIIKKLLFAPFFITLYALLLLQLKPLFTSYDFIFSLSSASLIQLGLISVLVCLTSLSFVLFATIASDWNIVAPIGLLTAILPLLEVNQTDGLVLTVGSIVAFTLTFASLENKLKSYLNFQSSTLLGPSIRSLATFLLIIFSVVYFLSINQIINKSGFQIPDSLIDTTLKLVPQMQNEQTGATSQLSVPKEQLDLLKKNPALLKQAGVDPKILDSLNQPNNSSQKSSNPVNDLLKNTVKDQLQNFLKPYLTFMPAVLAMLLFFTLQSLTSILQLLIYPLLWLIFLILEKTGFIKFEIEQRPVKKLVV